MGIFIICYFIVVKKKKDFVPEMLHVVRVNLESNELDLSREPVMVESGCSCRFNREPLDIIG